LARADFDLFVPNNSLGAVADKLIAAAKQISGRAVGWTAFETARIEAGIPRFGADMDETNIPLECGIESRAVVLQQRLLHRAGSHQPHPQRRPCEQGIARLAAGQ
jgi:glycine cleavage system aminomethyltransferase T